MEENNEQPIKKVKKVKKIKKIKKIKKAGHALKKTARKIKKTEGLLKNLSFGLLAILLFTYAGIITFTGSIFNNNFDLTEFEKKAEESSSFIVSTSAVQYKVKPNLHGIITVYDFSADWVGNQKLFSAKRIVIETNNPFCVFTKNFDINNMKLFDVFYADQHLPDGQNKLYIFPSGFHSDVFGTDKIKLKPGDVEVKNFKITYTTPGTYDEKIIKQKTYPKQEVRAFLKQYAFHSIDVI